MTCQEETLLVKQIFDLYEQISSLKSLQPLEDVDTLFTQLLHICNTSPLAIDLTKLCTDIQQKRYKLVLLSAEIEGLLENQYSTQLLANDKPLDHLPMFPRCSIYMKHCLWEYNILTRHSTRVPKRVAFVGSGPLPISAIFLATYHLPTAQFDNYDLDGPANETAARVVGPDPDLSVRMRFHTKDVMNTEKDELEAYDVIFLSVLVGKSKEEKVKVFHHLAKSMAPGSTLMIRSTHGAQAFLYPFVDPDDIDRCGFDVLAVCHSNEEMITNSVVVARKPMDNQNGLEIKGF